jgi:uncharacterized membrane protein YdjX (TVP38/TMEM64 family)
VRWARLIQLGFIVAVLVLLAIYLPFQTWLVDLFGWSQLNPNLALLAFSGLIVLGMVLMFPVSIQSMAAGFIFGLNKGFAVMCLGGLIGFTAAFLVGRSLARPWIEKWAGRRPEIAAIDKAIKQKGLVVVILARLSQILPYNLLNYSFGLTSVSLRDYVVGSAVGMLPGIFMFVFLGTTATDIAAIMSGKTELGDFDLWIGAFGVLVLAMAVTVITRVAQKALKDQMEHSG